jgi:hypothetical protein
MLIQSKIKEDMKNQNLQTRLRLTKPCYFAPCIGPEGLSNVVAKQQVLLGIPPCEHSGIV